MTDERWEQITALIQKNFEVAEHDKEDLEPGEAEYYVFNGPLGKMRLERIIRPKVLDTKVHSSARIGGTSREEIIYAADETVSFIKAYQWDEDEGDWAEVNLEGMF